MFAKVIAIICAVAFFIVISAALLPLMKKEIDELFGSHEG